MPGGAQGQELGVTRLSLGIENFDDEILRTNGRAHVSKEIWRCLPWIEKQGFRQGEKQGEKQGLKQGADNEKMRAARRMFKDGLPIETIRKYTGLSLGKIKKLIPPTTH